MTESVFGLASSITGGVIAQGVLLGARIIGFSFAFSAVPCAILSPFCRCALAAAFFVFLLPFLPQSMFSAGESLVLIEHYGWSGLMVPELTGVQLLAQLGCGLLFGLQAGMLLYLGAAAAGWCTALLTAGVRDDDAEALPVTAGFQSVHCATMAVMLMGLLSFAPDIFRFFAESFVSLPVTRTGFSFSMLQLMESFFQELVSMALSSALIFGLPMFLSVFGVTLAAFFIQRTFAAAMSDGLFKMTLIPLLVLLIAARIAQGALNTAELSSAQLSERRGGELSDLVKRGPAK